MGTTGEELEQHGYREFYRKLPMSLLPCLVRASTKGVQLNTAERERLITEQSQVVKQAVVEIKSLAGQGFNHNSYKQLCDYFIGQKGIKPIIKRATKRPTFDDDALEELDRKYGLQEFSVLRRLSKAEHSGQVLRCLSSKDGRFRCSYNIAGTETGRLSSSEAPDGSGTNGQNLNAEVRKLFTADLGCVLVKADLKQAENIMVAYLSQDIGLIRAAQSGQDMHTQIAKMIFRKEEITKDERQLGKKINHASSYGMGPKRLVEVAWEDCKLKLSLKDAKGLLESHLNAFPGIRRWHLHIQSLLGRGRQITNPFGRTRRFLGYWGDSLFREGYAFLPQSSIADKLNLDLITFDKLGLDVRMQIHDEIVFCVQEYALIDTVKCIKQVMEEPFKVDEYSVTIPVDIKTGLNWGECHEFKETALVSGTGEG